MRLNETGVVFERTDGLARWVMDFETVIGSFRLRL